MGIYDEDIKNPFSHSLYTYNGVGDFSPNAFSSFMAGEIKRLHGIVLNKNSSAVIANNFFKGKDKSNTLLNQLIKNDEDWALIYLLEPEEMKNTSNKIISIGKASMIGTINYFNKTQWPAPDSAPVKRLLTLGQALGYISHDKRNALASLCEQLSQETEQIHNQVKLYKK